MLKMENISAYMGHSFSLSRALGWWGVTLLLALLGAHFFRASVQGAMLCCLGAMALHCGHASWKRYAVSFFLAWGAFEWAGTAFFLAQMRMQAGLPWLRASLILFTVAFVTVLGSIALYRHAEHNAAHEQENDAARMKGIVFIVIFCLLFYAAKSAPFPLLLAERIWPRFGQAQIFFMALYGAFILGLLLDPARSREGRKWIWLAFSLVFFGQLAAGLLGSSLLLMTGKLHIPVPAFILFGPAYRGSFSMMLPLVLVSVLLLGGAWCSMLCYFGAFDLCASSRKPVKPLPPSLLWLTQHGRSCTLAGGVMVAVLLGISGISVEIALAASALFVVAGLLIMLVLSSKYNSMMHCTAFCPMGLVVNLLAKISPWRMAVDKILCDNCGACEKVCKYRAITTQSRAEGKTLFNCTLCRDCVSVCKKEAIDVRAPFISKAAAGRVFALLLVVLHTAFLALARV